MTMSQGYKLQLFQWPQSDQSKAGIPYSSGKGVLLTILSCSEGGQWFPSNQFNSRLEKRMNWFLKSHQCIVHSYILIDVCLPRHQDQALQFSLTLRPLFSTMSISLSCMHVALSILSARSIEIRLEHQSLRGL